VLKEIDLFLKSGTTHVELNQADLQTGIYLIRLTNQQNSDTRNLGMKPIRLVITK
jgi:hypothetical protein